MGLSLSEFPSCTVTWLLVVEPGVIDRWRLQIIYSIA